jgi:hypothetical protein
MANGTTGTAQKDAKFLELLSQGATVGAAARGAGYARRSLYRWRKARADFAAAWDDALAEGTDLLEDEALRRAKDGFDEPRFYEGQVCGHVRRYSDTLLIFLLKARRPGKYGDKVTAEHTGPGGGPITQITRVIVEPPSKSEHLSPC